LAGDPSTLTTRRQTIVGAIALGGYAITPFSVGATSLQNLSVYAAERAKALASGRTVQPRILVPEGSEDNIAPVIQAFREMSGIEVMAEQIALEDMNTHLILRAFTNDRPYDIALPATFGMPDLVNAGAIRPVTEFARLHEPEGLRSGILFNVGDSYDDEIYGFQADGDTYVMFYNATMLNDPAEQDRYAAETGADLAIPTTWRELDRQMAFFHRPDQGLYGGALFRVSGYLAWEWWVRFHAKGVWPFSPEMEPQIASDQGVEALVELIAATKHQTPEAPMMGLFENWRRYGRGDVYCNMGWGGTQKYLNGPESSVKGKLVYGPTPGGLIDGQVLKTPYFNWGWNYVVSQSSAEPEIAYLFSLFASSPDISTKAIRAQGGYFDPIRPEHYDDQIIRDVYSDEFLKVHRQSLQSSIPDLYIANQSEYFGVLNNWLDAALNKEVEPRKALERAAQEWTLITIRAGVEGQKERWARLKKQYPRPVRQRLRDL